MGTPLLFLASYATAFAVAGYALVWISVVVLGRLEAEYGGVAGNLQTSRQILLFMVPFATLLAAFGVPRTHQEWVRRRATTAIAVGAASGTLTVVAFFAIGGALEIIGRALPKILAAILLFTVQIFVLASPTIVTYALVRLAGRSIAAPDRS